VSSKGEQVAYQVDVPSHLPHNIVPFPERNPTSCLKGRRNGADIDLEKRYGAGRD